MVSKAEPIPMLSLLIDIHVHVVLKCIMMVSSLVFRICVLALVAVTVCVS